MSKKAGKKQTVRPLSAALRYATERLHVVPLHGLKDGRCTCGNADCRQPGMHPRPKYGVADATLDLALIEKRWTKWSKAKIGIVFGGSSKIAGPLDRWRNWTAEAARNYQDQRRAAPHSHDLRW